MIRSLNLKQPINDVAKSKIEAQKICENIGFPIVIRPSYVLGGRAMEIIHNMDQLNKYISEAVRVSGKNPVLIDQFLKMLWKLMLMQYLMVEMFLLLG